MSLRQMEYFVTVVAAGSFTRAAEQLHVTQPALSHQIKALERSVGGPLLERLPRGVRLTPMGRAFLPHAEVAVGSAAQAERAARAAAGAVGGELHVAAVHSVAAGLLPPVFARWRRERPGVELVLHEYARDEDLDDSMERGVADVAVGHGGGGADARVRLGDEEVVVVLPAGDPLIGAAPMALTALAERDWIRCAMEPVVEGRPFIDLACERVGFAPRTAVRTEHTTTAVAMAAAGAGVAVVPSYAVPPGTPAVPLAPPWRRPLYAWSRTAFAGPAAALVALLTTAPGAPLPPAGRPRP